VETEKTYSSGDHKARSNVNLLLTELMNKEHMKKELETKMTQSKRVESGSSVSGGSSDTPTITSKHISAVEILHQIVRPLL
jgi:hypothetical protein